MSRHSAIFSAILAIGAMAAAGSANAADLASRPYVKAPVAVDPATNWTGFYLGLNAGYGWNRDQYSDVAPQIFLGDTPAGRAGGFVGGGHVGFNWQVSRFVLGVEGDIDSSAITVSVACAGAPPGFCATSQNYVASIRGRAGIAFDHVLLYATGGAAFTKYDHAVTFPGFPGPSVLYPGDSRTGWVAGAGMEYAFAGNWIIGAEYKHYDFGDRTLSAPQPLGGPLFQNFRETQDTVVARISYKFGGPVVAKY